MHTYVKALELIIQNGKSCSLIETSCEITIETREEKERGRENGKWKLMQNLASRAELRRNFITLSPSSRRRRRRWNLL